MSPRLVVLQEPAAPVGPEWGALTRGLVKGADFLKAAVQKVKPNADPEKIVDGLPWGKFEDAFLKGWESAALTTVRLGIKEAFAQRVTKAPDPKAPLVRAERNALAWLETHGLELVDGIAEESRLAGARIVAAGIEEGWGVPEMARRMRDVVGLNRVQAGRLLAMAKTLKAAQVTDAKMDGQLRRFGDKLLKERAELIAQTESIAARNEGHLSAWLAQQQEGTLPKTAQKEWIAANTPKSLKGKKGETCAYCKDLDGLKVPLAGTFPGGARRPPAHPGCRCSMGVVD